MMDRRRLLAGTVGTALTATAFTTGASSHASAAVNNATRSTLEAFTDTLIPGAKRYPGDAAVAGAASGPGGAHGGYIALLTDPRIGIAPYLDGIAAELNIHAVAYAIAHGVFVSPFVPAFVALTYPHRTNAVASLFERSNPDRGLWAVMALLSALAFDCATHLPTVVAISQRHPGITFIGFPPPGPDGLWRNPEFSYRRPLAVPHPGTTPSGQPA